MTRADPDRTVVPYLQDPRRRALSVWGTSLGMPRLLRLDIRFSQYQGKYERNADTSPEVPGRMGIWLRVTRTHISRNIFRNSARKVSTGSSRRSGSAQIRGGLRLPRSGSLEGRTQYTDEYIKA